MSGSERNAPCPCGSGLKYKRCCLSAARGPASGDPTNGRMAEVQNAVRGAVDVAKPRDMAEAQALVGAVMERQNTRPLDDFEGLSAERMGRFMYHPFDSAAVVEMPDRLETEPDVPVIAALRFLIDAIDDGGLKLTAKGNLPRSLVRAVHAERILPDVLDPLRRHARPPASEDDFPFLTQVRRTAEFAGLIADDGKRLRRTPLLHRLTDAGGARALYPAMFEAGAMTWNWGWGDLYAELRIVQTAWLYSLYLVAGIPSGESRSASDLAAAFVRAFPATLHEAEADGCIDAREEVVRCWRLRTLERFAGPFGLVSLESMNDRPFSPELAVRPTPLLYDAVRFGRSVVP